MTTTISRKPPEQLWRNGGPSFLAWITSQLDVLSEEVGMPLSVAPPEESLDAYGRDILVLERAGKLIVAALHTGQSYSAQLGELITSAAMLRAKAAIWIVGDARPEHVGTVIWLNRSKVATVYLVKVGAAQMGGSDPIPLLTLIVGPGERPATASGVKKELPALNGTVTAPSRLMVEPPPEPSSIPREAPAAPGLELAGPVVAFTDDETVRSVKFQG